MAEAGVPYRPAAGNKKQAAKQADVNLRRGLPLLLTGPAFWGLINPEWSLCNRGRRQSPVNLEPDKLLFDPNLRLLHVDKHRVGVRGERGHSKRKAEARRTLEFTATFCSIFQVNGVLVNTGHSAVFTVDNTTRRHVNVTGGPLSYLYQLHELHLHYGLHDDMGSEHTVNGHAFPAEVGAFAAWGVCNLG